MRYTLPSILLLIAIFGLTADADAEKTQGISCLGRIIAGERTIIVSAPSGSVIDQLLVRRGDRVKKGDELARLRDYAQQAAAAEGAKKEIALSEAQLAIIKNGERPELLSAQQAVVDAKEAAVRLQQGKYERNSDLHEKAMISDDAYDATLYAYEEARAALLREKNVLSGMLSGKKEEINEADARIAVAEANYRLALARLEAQSVRAPIKGEVLSIKTYPGETVGDQGILELADTEEMMILAEVYETDIAQVRIGAKARITSAVFKGEATGTVTEIGKEVETGQVYAIDPRQYTDRRVIQVRIKPDAPGKLSSFNSAQVTVILNQP